MTTLSNTTPARLLTTRLAAFILSILLTCSVLIYCGYHLAIATQADDTNHLETPLALTIARQLSAGPGALYGPFDGDLPLVLIHAPLYYRLAALVAWPLTALGIGPVAAAFASGRAIAFVAFLLTLWAAARVARLDNTSTRVGFWSALLIAASPVLGSFPVTVRPDTLGLAFQTVATFLILRELLAGTSRTRMLTAAYVLFALAFCAKQHDVVAGVVSSGLLAWACVRKHSRILPIIFAHLAGLATLLLYYGAEYAITGGWVLDAAFFLPSALGKFEHASWGHVVTVFVEVAKMSAGLLALALACACAGGLPAFRNSKHLDVYLASYAAGEILVMVALCKNSSGAWTNYAQQAVVWGAILIARLADRVLANPPAAWRTGLIACAGLILVAADTRLTVISATARRDDMMALGAMLADGALPPAGHGAIYFVGAPQHNRRFGRVELAHDEWLYSAFETLHAAEPREVWLRQALCEGPVQCVVVPGESPQVRGLAEPLPDLGYQPAGHYGRYVVWLRPADGERYASETPPSRFASARRAR